MLNDEDLNQAKPVYGGWLLLAPEGTDFDNPVHRSRKWQRRFFILYEHGLLRYALDEMPTTLPQGTINMNQCTDVVDGESRTGQKFSLCILTPEKEHFIRAENKEIISGWLEMLIVYPRTNKQNQKKKRKVEPPTPQEPGPAKMAVTSSNIPNAEKVPTTKSTLWQEEMRGKDQLDGSSSISPAQSPMQSQTMPASSLKEPVLESKEDESAMNGDRIDCGRKARVESGYFSLEKTKQDSKLEEQQLPPPPSPPSPSTPNNRRSQVIEKFEALDIENAEHMETNASAGPSLSSETRQGRSEKRVFPRKRDLTSETAAVGSILEVSSSPLSPHRRAKSLDRRSTESSMTPDLLNFKKGWLTKQYEDGQWKKHWFVLTDSSLRYYRDSNAEEADDLDGEIDLRSCTDVTEYAVQRNYGFQIHTKDSTFTLSAMTSGIRRNWIEALRKNVRPATAPDVTKLSDCNKENSFRSCVSQKGSLRSEEQWPGLGSEVISKGGNRKADGPRHVFDYVELSPLNQGSPQRTRGSLKGISDRATKQEDLERDQALRFEERRKWFEAPDPGVLQGDSPAGALSWKACEQEPLGPALSEDQRSRLNEEIEKKWLELERLPLKESKRIPLTTLLNQSKGGHGDTREALEKEVQTLREQLESWRARSESLRDTGKSSGDVPLPQGFISQEACERSLAEMESLHQKVMSELQRHHQWELERLRQEKERLLAEEAAATAAAIEALKKVHKEELNKEVGRTRHVQLGGSGSEALRRQHHRSDVDSLKRELQVLSEQYSQKCLEIGDLTQKADEREQMLQRCQQEGKELLQQNQELQKCLSEEIQRLRTFIASQGTGDGALHNNERSSCELEVLLRVKENELQYLKKEVQCLKEELQMMQKDKRFASGKYQDVYVELNHIKLRSEREIEQLKEHLRLAMAALQEKETLCNSISE